MWHLFSQIHPSLDMHSVSLETKWHRGWRQKILEPLSPSTTGLNGYSGANASIYQEFDGQFYNPLFQRSNVSVA
jgi:hypothetical protein